MSRAAESPARSAAPARAGAAAAIQRAPLRVARGPIPTATGLAQRLGWLGPDAAPVATAQDADLREGETTGALWQRSEGAPTRLIGLTWVDTFQAVVTLPGAGIDTFDQLAGRRVALPYDRDAAIDVHRAAASRGLHAALGLAGIFPGDVEHVEIDATHSRSRAVPYGAELHALARGEVDAVFVAGAQGVAAAARVGAVAIADHGRHLDPAVRTSATTPAAITVEAERLEREPDAVVRLLAVLLRAGAWARHDAERATRLLALETGTTVCDVRAAHPGNWSDRLDIDLSYGKLEALEAQHDFLVVHGFLACPVDLAAWVDPRPLAGARDLLLV